MSDIHSLSLQFYWNCMLMLSGYRHTGTVKFFRSIGIFSKYLLTFRLLLFILQNHFIILKIRYKMWGLKKNQNFQNHLGKFSFVISHSHHSLQTTVVALLAESQVHSFSSGVYFMSFSAS